MLLPSVLVFLLLLLLVLPWPSTSQYGCNDGDRNALVAMKSFWGNPDFLSLGDPSISCCQWDGVHCSAAGNVIGLTISDHKNLTGAIPPAVGNLTSLTHLVLSYLPNLAGPIPSSLSLLPNLSSLTLSSNSLTGPIPSFLSSLPNLYYINLSHNKLVGSIPPSLPSSLTQLTFLRLDHNRLTGSISSSFGNLPSRSILYLAHNHLSGSLPWSLGNVDFKGLDLSSNSLSGDASFLFRPRNTSFPKWINLSKNKLEFDLGAVEGFPLLLRDLDISRNRIYGGIPWQIVDLSELSHLNVSGNHLCGQIPTGGNMVQFGESSYAGNRCLCGTPLPTCT